MRRTSFGCQPRRLTHHVPRTLTQHKNSLISLLDSLPQSPTPCLPIVGCSPAGRFGKPNPAGAEDPQEILAEKVKAELEKDMGLQERAVQEVHHYHIRRLLMFLLLVMLLLVFPTSSNGRWSHQN